jgi:hypothetical protein
LPSWLGSIIAMLAAIILGVVPYVLVRAVLSRDPPDVTQAVAGTVAFRVGAVHALILALVFAEAHENHADLREEVSKEITAIEHISQNLKRWGGPETQRPRELLDAYVTGVIDYEWDDSARPAGDRQTRQVLNDLDLSVLDLKAANQRQEALRTRMLEDVRALEDHRKIRLSLTHRSVPGLFWWVALIGFAITVALFFVFPATLLHVLMLAAYSAYTGLVLYFVLALSHPFLGPAAINEEPYALVLQTEVRGD